MNRMQNNIARHYQRLFTTAGVDVVYIRGDESVEISAVPGQTAVQVEDASGVSVRSKRRDWIVEAASLVLHGGTETPLVGDTIRVIASGRVMTYEVQKLVGEDCWRPCDDLGTYLRIHTRLVGMDAGEGGE